MKQNKAWEEWEKKIARDLDSKVTKGSGNGRWEKGDVHTKTTLIDAKYTSKGSYRLTSETWDEIWMWALNAQKDPVVAIRVEGYPEVVVIEESLYDELTMRPVPQGSAMGLENRTGKVIRPKRMSRVEPFRFGHQILIAYPYEDFVELLKARESRAHTCK